MQPHNNLNLGKSLEAYSEVILTDEEKDKIISILKEKKYWRLLAQKQARLAEGTNRETTELETKLIEFDHSLEIPKTDLTQEEIDEAFLIARREKYGEQKRKEYQQKILQQPTYMLQTMDSFKANFLKRGNVLDSKNTEIFEALCKYFLGGESGPLDLKKGLALGGNVGCGKTTMMEFFQFNQTRSYIIKSVRDIAGQYSLSGYPAIARYNDIIKFGDIHLSYGQTDLGVCFDDLGTEDEKKHFGNESNVMAEIMLNRYDKAILRGKTHITTNLSGDEIEQRYGTRVRSRMREMFNFVKFPTNAEDRRK